MTASTSGGSGSVPARRAGRVRWRPAVDRAHKVLSAAALGGAAAIALAWPAGAHAMAPWGGVALLVGGALIGVPHGSSDFVVARRVLPRRLGRAWLPIFLVVYLAVVASVMGAWLAAPLATLLAFVLLSCLHFGHGDLGPGGHRTILAVAVRATTPLLPVLLVHAAGVAPLVGLLAGVDDDTALAALAGLRWLFVPWALAVVCHLLGAASAEMRGRGTPGRSVDALEVGAIAVAAVALPPLLAFALYFCLVHAIRHMVGIADEHAPRDARRAAFLVAAVILPSAAACFVALALTWNGVGGALGTTELIAWSLRLVAALTVPHMALEAWAERCNTSHNRQRV